MSMSASTSSHIRVFVQWKDSTVFAGEDVECTITFKNVAVPQLPEKQSPSPPKFAPGPERQRKLPPVQSPTRPSISRHTSLSSQQQQHLRGHRPALSLSSPSLAGDRRSPALPSTGLPNGSSAAAAQAHKHQRSLSIISLGTDAAAPEASGPPRRPARGHARSASLQVVPGRANQFGAGGHRAVTHHSPLSTGGASPPTIHEPAEFSFPMRPGRRSPGNTNTAAPSTPGFAITTRKPSNSISHSFKFPPTPSQDAPGTSPRKQLPHLRGSSPRLLDDAASNPNLETLSPVARVLSGSSMNGTPRSSSEFYSIGNQSTETLASEYMPQPTVSARLLPRVFHQRTSSQFAQPRQNVPETLMMGYAQIMGSFTLDGALINQAPFEEVKRKGVVGGQGGGGVVGVDRKTRESGLFGSFGWSNIGESLGGLLGASEPSSIREMNRIAGAKSVPLITTPQSILFVDLRLAPGESRSYSYSFTLPRGLPPTHKGRSIKVEYHLTIGTQRPGSARDGQQVKHVEIPFRVFGSVNSRGELLGHDLMSPYIILRDQARTASISSPSLSSNPQKRIRKPEDSLSEFLAYVDNLLDRPRHDSSGPLGLLSPTADNTLLSPSGGGVGRSPSIISLLSDEPRSMKDTIDLAILRSNTSASSQHQSNNRFAIARSGHHICTLTLTRPAFRLGETIALTLDFTSPPFSDSIPVYSVHVSLETSEKVDPAIALRSESSIYRVTRKVWAEKREKVLWARRVSVGLGIPASGTPGFVTTGVELEWRVRVGFVTPRAGVVQASGRDRDADSDRDEEDEERAAEQEKRGGADKKPAAAKRAGAGTAAPGPEILWDTSPLLEEISSDDRGVVLAAAQRLVAESFEVQVPVRVYGAVTGAPESNANPWDRSAEDGMSI